MPREIKFTTINATSEDPKFKYTELNEHKPTVKGWQSEKDCDYPQEIVLKTVTRCQLYKIQILVHQFMIPSKVELFLSNDDLETDIGNIKWEYLGYITLSTNETTEFKSRELKSAVIPKKEVTFVKINLLNNHFNCMNEFNQVSLIAVNLLGIDLESQYNANKSTEESKLFDILNDPDYCCPYDDLAFLMYVDSDVAKTIQEMEIKKHLAVINERFEYARKLKNAMIKLRTAGEKLAKYELEKRYAIEIEDYDKARFKKNQMDTFRLEIYEELMIEQLMEYNGICSKNDEECHDETDKPHKSILSPVLSKATKTSPNHQVSPLHMPKHLSPNTGSPCSTGSPTPNLQNRNGSFRRRNKVTTKSTYEMYEEKPLPALRHSQTNEFLRECQIEIEQYKTASKLTEREKKQAALPILVFGSDLVEKFYSKHYCDKEDGLNDLKDELISYDNTKLHVPNKVARGAIFLLHRSLRDKVFSVYSLANEVIRLFFVQFVPGRVTSTEVARSVDKLLPELLTKSGDTSQRINQMAVHTILTMADCKSVRDLHIIPVHLSRPVNSITHPRLALSRAEMVEQLIINHGISSEKQSGLTCRTLSEFGLSGLHHPAEAVRKIAEKILVLVYQVNPRLVRKQLPPDDDITRRNLLYRQLFQEFDKIDSEIAENYYLVNCKEIHSSRKKEPLEKKQVQQELSKCPSTNNIKIYTEDVQKNYQLSKSKSGNDLPMNGTKDKSSSSASAVSSPNNDSHKDENERQCIFCKQTETLIFTTNNSMNSHYWRSCPMLIRCKECNQVVEISALTEHLLMECDKREEYSQCTRCTEAFLTKEKKKHDSCCKSVTECCSRCPLCHENLSTNEDCWRNHLMGENPCVKNNRVKPKQKQVKIQI